VLSPQLWQSVVGLWERCEGLGEEAGAGAGHLGTSPQGSGCPAVYVTRGSGFVGSEEAASCRASFGV